MDKDWSKVRVAVGKAQINSCLPDPFFPAVKAAMNYLSYCGMALLPACPQISETSSNGEVNTNQGKEDDSSGERDLSVVARSFQDRNRKLVEVLITSQDCIWKIFFWSKTFLVLACGTWRRCWFILAKGFSDTCSRHQHQCISEMILQVIVLAKQSLRRRPSAVRCQLHCLQSFMMKGQWLEGQWLEYNDDDALSHDCFKLDTNVIGVPREPVLLDVLYALVGSRLHQQGIHFLLIWWKECIETLKWARIVIFMNGISLTLTYILSGTIGDVKPTHTHA